MKRFSQFSSVQLLSHVWLFVIPWTAACQASLSITNSRSWLKHMSIELVISSNHLILCCPLLLPPSIFPSIRVFSNESLLCIRWPKYWSFSFSISPSKEHSGLISFRMDWLDLLAVQGTLKSLLQHHSSKAAILWRSAFFMVELYEAVTGCFHRQHAVLSMLYAYLPLFLSITVRQLLTSPPFQIHEDTGGWQQFLKTPQLDRGKAGSWT